MDKVPKVLVIDDEPDVLAATSRILAKAGCDVLEANSGSEGLAVARREVPDLILLDVVLGDENGIDICRQIKADPALRHTYVALASGKRLATEEVVAGLDAGAEEYFCRPFRSEEFISRLRTLFRLQRTEARLRDKEEFYRTTLASVGDAVISTDTEGRVADLNTVAESLTGWRLADALGKPMGEVLPIIDEKTRHTIEDPIARALREDDVVRLPKDALMLTEDGSEIPIADSAAPIRNGDGQVTGVVLVFRDQTDERDAKKALAASEERFRLAMEATTDGVWDWKCGTGDVYYSPSWGRLLGLTTIEPTVETWQSRIHPEDRDAVLTSLQNHLEGTSPHWGAEHRLRHAGSQEYVWVLGRGSVITRDQDGHPLRMVGTMIDISEQKKAETKLRESRESLQLAMEIASAGSWEWNVETNLVTFSETALRMLGHASDFPLQSGEWWIGRIHTEDRPLVEQVLSAFMAGEVDTYQVEFRLATAACDYIWVASTARIVRSNEQGKPLLIAGVHRDITADKQATQDLRESENRYARLTANIPGVVYQYLQHEDPAKSEFPYISPGVTEMYGLTPEEILRDSRLMWASIHPEDVADFAASIERAVETGSRWEHEWRVNTPAGETKWLKGAASQERRPDGRILWDGLLLDITEQKSAEAELRKRETLLADAEAMAVIGGWEIDPQTQGLNWTDGTYRIHDLPVGADVSVEKVINYYPGPAADEIRHAVEQTMKTGKPYDLILPFQTAAGRSLWVRTIGHAEVRDGKVIRVYGAIQDITESRRLQEQLQQSQKMESIGRLAGGVAHDFNNMLGVILGHAEIALESTPPSSPLRENLVEIRQAARRSSELTRQLLAFARKQTVTPKVLDLNQTISGMVKMLQRLIGEDTELVWLPGDDLHVVEMDPGQVDQILVNICVNARDAIEGVGQVEIVTANVRYDASLAATNVDAEVGDYVRVSVRDNGCGMAPETLAEAFDPFFTTKGIGKGTGLGLSTVYGIVRQNAGFIEIDSAPRCGTTFHIHIPRHRGKPSRSDQPNSEPIERGTETVLLVEDEAILLKLTRKMIERLDYQVLTAATPGEAVQTAREHPGPIDLLVTDVIMPEMNGRDLAKRLLSLYPGMKRLFVSGYTADVIAHRGILEEGVHFLQKPFTAEELAVKLRAALSDR